MKLLLALPAPSLVQRAVEQSASWAMRLGGTLDVAVVLDEEDSVAGEEEARARSVFDAIDDGHRGVLHVVRGEVVVELIQLSGKVDVLIAASRRESGLRFLQSPSVTGKLARLARCPVLVPSPEEASPRTPTMLMTLDLEDPPDQRVFQEASEWAKRLGYRIDLLYVDPFQHRRTLYPDLPTAPGSSLVMRKDESMARLQVHLEKIPFAQRGEALYEAGSQGEVGPFLRTADARRPRLILATSHGRGGLSHLLSGSFAHRLMRRCGHPLLFLHR